MLRRCYIFIRYIKKMTYTMTVTVYLFFHVPLISLAMAYVTSLVFSPPRMSAWESKFELSLMNRKLFDCKKNMVVGITK